MSAAAQKKPASVGQLVDVRQSHELVTHQVNPYLGMVATIIDRGGELANLDKILDLQIKWEANEARKAYVAAMAAFKAEPMEILKRKFVGYKTKDGDPVGYSHAELSDVTDVVVPAMGKHGLSHRWDITQAGGQITVTCVTTHALGHSESISMTAAPDDSGKKNKIQQVASTVSYLQRYTLLAATGMATKGMDDDAQGSEGDGDDGDGTGIDPNQAWYDSIDAAIDQLSLKAIKAEMVEAFGSAMKIPKVLIGAYNVKWDLVGKQ